MKLYYLQSNDKIIQTLYNDEVYKYDLTTMSPYYVFDIEEIEEKKNLCIDLRRTLGKIDKNGDQKYSIKDGKVEEKPGWEEYNPLET